MTINRDHELHRRRARRNLWLGLLLGSWVVLIFGITVVKMSNGNLMEGFDHSYRPSLEQTK